MDKKGGKRTKSNEERKIKDDTQEEDPEKKLSWPIPSLREEIPRGVDEGGDQNEDDAERGQGIFNLCLLWEKYQ
jgi:hypothetical protein